MSRWAGFRGAFRTVAAEARVARWIPHWAQQVASELDRAPADAVVADFNLVGALVAAEAAGVPSVALVHNVYRGPVSRTAAVGSGMATERRHRGTTS